MATMITTGTRGQVHTVPEVASDTFALIAATQTLTNKTITAPVLSGSVTGTYTLAGTPTITAPALSSPVLSGTATGTYTLAGTPSITSPTITGTPTISGVPSFTAGAGAATAALLLGGGTSTTKNTTAAADKNFIGFWTESTATSGDSRTAYLRHYFSGAGGGGEALRAYGTVNNVTAATGGTVNGAHVTLNVTGTSGKISGQANAARFTFDIAASPTTVGGVCAVTTFETNIATGPTIPTGMCFSRYLNLGTQGIDYLWSIEAPSAAMVANAGTGANSAAVSTGGVAAKVIKIKVDGTDYWLPLFSSNS